MKMKLTKSTLRKLIRETINTWHANHYTPYDDVFDPEDYMKDDVDVQKYVNSDGSWSVVINCLFDDTLSEPLRVFKSEEDAEAYSSKKVDVIHRAYINSGEL